MAAKKAKKVSKKTTEVVAKKAPSAPEPKRSDFEKGDEGEGLFVRAHGVWRRSN